MVSNKKDLNHISTDNFLRELRSSRVKTKSATIEYEIEYVNLAPYGAVLRHLTPVKYEDGKVDKEENIEKEEIRPLSPKQPSQKVNKRSFLQKGNGFIDKPLGRKPNIL